MARFYIAPPAPLLPCSPALERYRYKVGLDSLGHRSRNRVSLGESCHPHEKPGFSEYLTDA